MLFILYKALIKLSVRAMFRILKLILYIESITNAQVFEFLMCLPTQISRHTYCYAKINGSQLFPESNESLKMLNLISGGNPDFICNEFDNVPA